MEDNIYEQHANFLRNVFTITEIEKFENNAINQADSFTCNGVRFVQTNGDMYVQNCDLNDKYKYVFYIKGSKEPIKSFEDLKTFYNASNYSFTFSFAADQSKKQYKQNGKSVVSKICKACQTIFMTKDKIVNVILSKTQEGGGSRKRLDKCTVKELREKAKARGIKYNGLRKDELVLALRRGVSTRKT